METNRNAQPGRLLGGTALFDLSGKVAIMTGSGRGLGKAMAEGLASAGASVVTCSRTLEQAEQTAEEIVKAGGEAAATRVDTSDRRACEELINLESSGSARSTFSSTTPASTSSSPPRSSRKTSGTRSSTSTSRVTSTAPRSPGAECGSRGPAARSSTIPR
jgi:hypothetical protein